MKGVAAVATLCLLAAACSGQDRVFTADDTAIAVPPGATFAIALAENPSVGDDWRIAGAPDPAVVTALGNEYRSDDPGGQRAGSGGTRSFRFEARAPGRTGVTMFNCYRCGASGQPSPENMRLAKTITYAVTVS